MAGVFQGIGFVTLVSGFFLRPTRDTAIHVAGVRAIVPWSNGSGGGLAVVGRF